jgi:hypothetical protein
MSSELKRISIGVDMNAARMAPVEQPAVAAGNRFTRGPADPLPPPQPGRKPVP